MQCAPVFMRCEGGWGSGCLQHQHSDHSQHALQDSGGRINLDDLKDGDLDYGCDEVGLASLRQRLRRAVHNFEGDS